MTICISTRTKCFVAGFCLLCWGSTMPAFGITIWTGEGADNRWDNPDNWDTGEVPEPGTGNVFITERDGGGPLIEDGIDATADVLVAVIGESEMTMTGGTLELTGWGAWWADDLDTIARFNMSGGEVNYTGSPGIMELGWQPAGNEAGSSYGIWNMTGGEINAKGIDMPGKGLGGAAEIHLDGGVINVGTARGGLVMYEGGWIDITHGLMSLEGDQEERVEEYIDNGWITAFDRLGSVKVVFDGDFTTLTGMQLVMTGDYNENGFLDLDDLDVHAGYIAVGNAAGDLNGDGVSNSTDRIIWVTDLQKSWIGDANFDGEFDSDDLIEAFSGGFYETGDPATYQTGDWNGDGVFTSDDLLFAFAEGGYGEGVRVAVAAVPEPASMMLVAVGILTCIVRRRLTTAGG